MAKCQRYRLIDWIHPLEANLSSFAGRRAAILLPAEKSNIENQLKDIIRNLLLARPKLVGLTSKRIL